jgi:conserved oligomeric Golgi complex subunit 5
VLRALSPLEALYLSRSTSRLNEVVAQSLSGGVRSPPSMGEALAIARTVVNELDSSRFDPLLAKSVARNVASVLDSFVSRLDSLVSSHSIAY